MARFRRKLKEQKSGVVLRSENESYLYTGNRSRAMSHVILPTIVLYLVILPVLFLVVLIESPILSIYICDIKNNRIFLSTFNFGGWCVLHLNNRTSENRTSPFYAF
jgi:hypothetical protein